MKNRTLVLPGLLASCLLLTFGCKAPEKYSWGKYESSLYQMAKDPTTFQKYGESLVAQIQKAEGDNRVPPGIFAEYGYFLLLNKKNAEAMTYFQKEKVRWPESTFLMDKMIKVSAGPAPAPTAAPATVPATPAPAAASEEKKG